MSLSLGHLPTHLPEIVATALSCQGLMALADPLSRLVAGKKYAELSGTRRMDWRSRVVSFVFATGILIESFRLMGGKGYASLKADKVFGYSPEGGRLAGVAVGYFIWDTILCLRYWKVFGASFLVHGGLHDRGTSRRNDLLTLGIQ